MRQSKTLDDSFEMLSREAERWKERQNGEKSVAASLQTALSSYQSYLAQLNGTLEKQLRSFAAHLEGEGPGDGNVLARLKEEFSRTLAQEKTARAEMEAAAASQRAQMREEMETRLTRLQRELESVRGEVRAAKSGEERATRLAQLAEERARDEAAEAAAVKEEERRRGEEQRSVLRAYEKANERLKEKVRESDEQREKDKLRHKKQLEEWQEEMRGLKREAREAHERAERAAALEGQLAQLEQSNVSLDSLLSEAKHSKEDFVYSVQVANERLKEKLRKSEEVKVHLLNELETKTRLAADLERSEARRVEALNRLQEVQSELDRASRYKDDWMSEVKRRVLLEEKGNTEAGALRVQLEQANATISGLRAAASSAASIEETRLRDEVAAARQAASTVQRRLQEAEASYANAAATAQNKSAQVEELQRRVAEMSAEGTRLQAQLSEVQASRDAVVAQARDEQRRADERLQRLDEELRSEQRKTASLQLATKQLESEIARAKASQSDDLQGRVQELLNTSGSMAQQLDSASSREADLTRELEDTQATVNDLKDQLAQQEQELKEISETTRLWKVRFEKAFQDLKREEEANAALASSDSSKTQAIEVLQKKVAAFEADLANRTAERAHRDEADARAETERVRAAATIDELQSRLAHEERRLHELGAVHERQWREALRGAATDHVHPVKTFLHSARAEGVGLDDDIRAALQKYVELKEAPPVVVEKVVEKVVVEKKSKKGPKKAEKRAREEKKEQVEEEKKEQVDEEEEQEEPPAKHAVVAASSPEEEKKEQSVQEIVSELRGELEKRADTEFAKFEMVQSKSVQHPFGLTVFAKVDIGGEQAIWVRMFLTNGSAPSLNSAQGPKPLSEEMFFFDEWDFHFEKVQVLAYEEEQEEEEHVAEGKHQRDEEAEQAVVVSESKKKKAKAPSPRKTKSPPSAGKKTTMPPVESSYALRKKK